ncbi:hypothetical protein ACFO0O_00635, partial [Cobetia amphilecti]|uniref:hypothetical protein n=1 Tax=Cobetia amphilecti TaxID=1055104 RepID=UPI00360D75FD
YAGLRAVPLPTLETRKNAEIRDSAPPWSFFSQREGPAFFLGASARICALLGAVRPISQAIKDRGSGAAVGIEAPALGLIVSEQREQVAVRCHRPVRRGHWG